MEPDLASAAAQVATLVAGIPEGDDLSGPTPCSDYALGDLLEHVASLTVAFAGSARKTLGDDVPPPGSVANLDPDWRTSIPRDLTDLVGAWREPGAMAGTTKAGGIEFPAEVACTVALEELVIHGWDVARATGQPMSATDADLAVVGAFFDQFGPDDRSAIFGPEVAYTGADELARLVALSGRDPGWAPPR